MEGEGREQEARSRRREFVIRHLVFVTLALVLLWPAVQHPGWWLWTPGAEYSDLAVTHWPNAHFTRRALWEYGRFPVWRPTIMSGVPFAANPLVGLYYPLNWVFLFLPWLSLEVGFNVSALAHLWLAGAATYALMRRGLNAGVWGALVAGVAYEASPKLLAHLGAGHVGWVQAWAWLPAVVLCWLQVCRSASLYRGKWAGGQSARWAVAAGGALAMQFFADVRMAAYTLVAAVTLAFVFAIRHPQSATRCLSFVISSFAIFLGLTACQWLPIVALLSETTRASMTLHDAAAWSLPWQYLAGLLLANHGGFHEWMTYVGVSTLVLAGSGIGVAWRRREDRWLVFGLVGLSVGAAWFSLGENGGLFQVLWRVVPGLGLLRVPPRAWVVVVFAIAVLAGLGVEGRGDWETRRPGDRGTRRPGDQETRRPGDQETRGPGDQETRGPGDQETRRPGDKGTRRQRDWRGGRGRRRRGLKRWEQALLMGVGIFPPLLVIGYWLLVGMPPLNMMMFGVVTPLAAVLGGFRFEVPGFQTGSNLEPVTLKPGTIPGLAAVLLVAVDLLVVDTTLVEARSPGRVFADGRAAAERLAAQPGRFRVYSPSYSIPQHVAELYGLELADGVDPLQLRVYADYLTHAAGLEPGGYSVTLPPFLGEGDVSTALAGVAPDAEMMGQLGVRYVAAAFPVVDQAWRSVGLFEKVFIYENDRARPLPEIRGAGSVVLADGTTLFQYQPRAVYVGWAISGVMAVGLLSGWLMSQLRERVVF
jgi:hypothetical protein